MDIRNQSKDEETKKKPSKDICNYSISEEEGGDTADSLDIKPPQAIVRHNKSSSSHQRKKHSNRRSHRDEKESKSHQHERKDRHKDEYKHHRHSDANLEGFVHISLLQTSSFQEIKQFLSRLYKSKEEFINEYKRLYYEKAKSEELYLLILTELKAAVSNGNITILKNLKDVIDYMNEAENPITLRNYYDHANNPIKNTNLVILACKHNKVEVLNYLFDSNNTLLNNLPIDVNDKDEECHNAFYYAIHSSMIELLNTLINNWPGNYFADHLEELDEILSKAYEELKLKNVSLSDKMEVFVENKLIDLRFFSNTSRQDQSFKGDRNNEKTKTEERVKLILENINLLTSDYKRNTEKVDQRFLFIAKFIAQNIHILKRQLKSTYDRLPWEEIEFCLVSFVSSYVKQQEINLFYRSILNKSKILNHLENFAEKLKDEKDIIEDVNTNKDAVRRKLTREQVIAQIISNSSQFEELYNDYQRIRDIQSLKKINDYIKLALLADSKEKKGQLIITRTLQVIGEHLKNTLESPKLSNTTSELLLLSLPKNTRKIIMDLRNSLSHAESLFNRMKIEDNKDVNFFIGVQNDIKKVNNIITNIFYNNKIKVITILLKNIISTDNFDEIKELVEMLHTIALDEIISKDFKTIEGEKLENLIKELRDNITDKTNSEQELFNNINNIINSADIQLVNYIMGFLALRNLCTLLSDRVINHNIVRDVKFCANIILEQTALKDSYNLKDIIMLVTKILYSVESRIQCDNLDELYRLIYEIVVLVEFAIDDIGWIKKLRSELYKKRSFSPLHKQKKTYDTEKTYDNQLALKLSELKNILSDNVLSGQLTETFPCYKNNKKLQAVVEMLVLDIMSILGSSKNFDLLENNLLVLYESTPLLNGRCLRNHLAHDNALVDILLSDPSTTVILNAKKLIEENIMRSNKKIGKLVSDDSSKLREKYDQGLVTITNQETMFDALQEGNFESLKDCLRKGADINARNIHLWSTLHFAAKGPSLEVIKFILDQNLLNVKVINDIKDIKDIKGQSPLHVAAAHGRKNIVNFFVKEAGLYVDDPDNNGKTPLHIAAQNGHKDTVEILLENKANTVTQDVIGLSSLHYAIRNNHIDIAKIILAKDKNVDINESSGGFTPLHKAAEMGHLDLVNFLLEYGADINARNDKDWTPIHGAALNGHLEIVNTLILKGADVNAELIMGCTPLHCAVEIGHEKIARTLLKHGANVNAIDKIYKNAALHYAAKYGHEGIVKTLLEYKADPNINTFQGLTPLHLAVQNGLEIVNILLKHGVDINAKTKIYYWTPLHYAVKSGHEIVVEFLLENGAEVNAKTDINLTPLHIAARKGYQNITDLLIKYKARINDKDKHGKTPLHEAAINGSINVIDLLIKEKAEVNARTNDGNTALHIAAQCNHIDAITVLIDNDAEVNASAKDGTTPLYLAALEGNINIVDLLLRNKAEVDAKASADSTPLHMAVKAGHKEVVKILIAYGANINHTCDDSTPLFSAVTLNKKEIVELLLANKADIEDSKPLLLAVSLGYKDIVEILLKYAAHVDVKNSENFTPLHLAAIKGHKEIVNILITRKIDINARNIKGMTPLNLAAYNGHKDVVEILIARGANVSIQSNGGATPLHAAAVNGHSNVVKVLLSSTLNINIKDNKNRTSLELAVAYGHLEVVKTLLQYETIDMKGNGIWTILHIASHKSNLEMVRYLVDKGFDINDKTSFGYTPMQIAATEGHKDTIEFFLSKGLNINDLGTNNQTLLHYATTRGHLAVVEYLISQGIDVNAQDKNGVSPMHIAASFGYKNVIEILLKNGAVYNLVDKSHKKPLVMSRDENVINLLASIKNLFKAIKQNKLSEVESYIKMGAFVNAKNVYGGTPLHYAAWEGYDEIVYVLLQNRANSNAVDNKGFTPLHYAAQFSHLKVVKALLSNGAVYNAVSNDNKTPSDFTVNKNIINLFKLVSKSFKNVKNGKSEVINDLNRIKDVNTIRAIMGACNEENKTLVVVAVHSNFSKVKQLKEISQGDISFQIAKAVALSNQRKYQEALNIFESAFEKRKEILGPDNPGTLDIQAYIANILYVQGFFQEALNTLEEIFQKRKEVLGLNDKNTLNTRSTIALVLHRLGKNEEAFNIYQVVYPKQKEILGSDHSDTLDTQFHMALVLDAQGKYEEALNMNSIVFEKRKNMSDTENAVRAQNNIGMVLSNQGKYAEALEIYKEVFEKKKVSFGIDHPDTLRTLYNIAEVLFSQKKYNEALKAHQEVLNIQKNVLGPNHFDTLNTQYGMANVFFAQSKWVTALKAYKICFDQMEVVFGPNHPNVLDILKKISMITLILKYEGRKLDEISRYLQKDINIAASNGDIQNVQRLLKDGASPNDKDIDGRTSLH
ncbi:hypothetical protein DMN91_008767 [Ooceraea biroi]|uniref:Ankyrin-3 n=1 Tax=Ooceraea biroi TaxID=2015173 RepID=A0A3L8DD62_OOCBI|nr:uncharacterized protein LOC105276122 [Ooceraea biroi]XP_011331789.2 uncharacterized protein LOC105276122 [Ooceraea biroi]XP_011331790.2 uncharacterized protein LOC105276122 [Ooceraea biroi]RLU18410.1 hypothetical protein DMN91_008767 [Ooceraea biroi]